LGVLPNLVSSFGSLGRGPILVTHWLSTQKPIVCIHNDCPLGEMADAAKIGTLERFPQGWIELEVQKAL